MIQVGDIRLIRLLQNRQRPGQSRQSGVVWSAGEKPQGRLTIQVGLES